MLELISFIFLVQTKRLRAASLRKMEKTKTINEKILAGEIKDSLVLNSEKESKISQNDEND